MARPVSFGFRFLEYADRAVGLVFLLKKNQARFGQAASVRADTLAAFEEQLDALQEELEEIRREAQLRWAEHEARLYGMASSGTPHVRHASCSTVLPRKSNLASQRLGLIQGWIRKQ